jgi:ABC-type nitrate/sulfonate/bicarbonate transport system permease component
VLGSASVLGFLLLWEAVLAVVPWDPFFLTTPALIARAAAEQLLGGRLWHDIAVSAQAFVLGLGLAVVVGIPVGLVMGWRRRAEWVLDPLLTALYASP